MECSICLEDHSDYATLIPCGHVFGTSCIDLWETSCIEQEDMGISCPECRTYFEKILPIFIPKTKSQDDFVDWRKYNEVEGNLKEVNEKFEKLKTRQEKCNYEIVSLYEVIEEKNSRLHELTQEKKKGDLNVQFLKNEISKFHLQLDKLKEDKKGLKKKVNIARKLEIYTRRLYEKSEERKKEIQSLKLKLDSKKKKMKTLKKEVKMTKQINLDNQVELSLINNMCNRLIVENAELRNK